MSLDWNASWLRRLLFATCGLVVLAAACYVLIRLAPGWLTDVRRLRPAEADEARSRARTALLGVVAGCLALAGVVYTARTFALNRRGQLTDRFGKAIEQLGDNRTAVRLGGIYALERLAHESSDEHGPIFEVLTAYVRENSPWDRDAGETPEASVEIKAILSVLSRRNVDHERQHRVAFDLSGTNLRGISAPGIDLDGAELRYVQLQDADLAGARLDNVSFVGSAMRGVSLLNASVRDSSLADTDLTRAVLTGADLYQCTLFKACCCEAYFFGADLTLASLEQADLTAARSSKLTTVWPEGFDPGAAGVRERESP